MMAARVKFIPIEFFILQSNSACRNAVNKYFLHLRIFSNNNDEASKNFNGLAFVATDMLEIIGSFSLLLNILD